MVSASVVVRVMVPARPRGNRGRAPAGPARQASTCSSWGTSGAGPPGRGGATGRSHFVAPGRLRLPPASAVTRKSTRCVPVGVLARVGARCSAQAVASHGVDGSRAPRPPGRPAAGRSRRTRRVRRRRPPSGAACTKLAPRGAWSGPRTRRCASRVRRRRYAAGRPEAVARSGCRRSCRRAFEAALPLAGRVELVGRACPWCACRPLEALVDGVADLVAVLVDRRLAAPSPCPGSP